MTTNNPAPVTTSTEDAREIDPDLQKLIDSAPAHIWLDLGEETHLVHDGTTFRDLAGVTWSEDNATGVGIKYVRAPAAVTSGDAVAEVHTSDGGQVGVLWNPDRTPPIDETKLYLRAEISPDAHTSAYPPLPVPARRTGQQMSYDGHDKVFFDCYDSQQMREYVDTDRKERQLSACNFCLSEAAKAHAALRIDFKQATELLAMFGGEPGKVTLLTGEGHSGRGLYAHAAGHGEDGALFLGVADDEAAPETSEPMDAVHWAELFQLRAAVQGPAGYATWQDAATDERMRRVKAERALAVAAEGWQLVPKEPTHAMVKAAFAWSDAPTSAYRAMLSAAPQSEEGSLFLGVADGDAVGGKSGGA